MCENKPGAICNIVRFFSDINIQSINQIKEIMKFYLAKLEEIPNDKVLESVYPKQVSDQITLEERIDDGKCTECGGDKWIILPDECCLVTEGGKPYIECMGCGNITHL